MKTGHWMRGAALLAVVLLAAACGGDDDAMPDASFPYPAWDPGLPEASAMGARRGLVPARGLVHLHSPYSHDACDNHPKNNDGTIKEECLADLRAGLCTTAMDFAALTDHDDSMADADWGPELFLARGDDQLLNDGATGVPFASRMMCPDGRGILIFVGGENDLMPIMLNGHPAGSVQQRHDIYNGNDLATVNAYRGLGGLAWIAHSESKDLQLLRDLKLDGMEVYNLHAAIDPDIRRDWLGVPPTEAVEKVVEFADSSINPQPEPDLAILSFLEENLPSLNRWQSLLGEGNRMTVTAGTDAHENALPIMLRDGERGDSYRRMMRWFSNVVLVADPNAPADIEQALAQGRAFVVFEVLGTPLDFDMYAKLADGSTAEMGAELRVSDGVHIIAETPKVYMLDGSLPAPAIHTRVLRVDAGGAIEVGAGERSVDVVATMPGAYRVEVRMVPHHLGPYLRALEPRGYAEREYVWIYSNPIYVRP